MKKTKKHGRVAGFLAAPRRRANGTPSPGRFSAAGVQWTGSGAELVATFTITADELTGAAESGLLFTDQEVQRGIRPDVQGSIQRELSLANGYPDPKTYIFDAQKADDITEKLLRGELLFLNPLVWNLRPGKFTAARNDGQAELYIYEAKIYLPDSHHRQQAIVRAVHLHREAPSDFPKFSPSKQFKIELYFLSKEDEGNYFYAKNQLTKPTEKSKAFDLTTTDALSVLAKRFIDSTPALAGNVNRVTDRLTARNPQVATLSTIREMMRTLSDDELSPDGMVDDSELEGMATIASMFYGLLVDVRPELGPLDVRERRKVRQSSLVDAAVMMHGYAALMKEFRRDLTSDGLHIAKEKWRRRLGALSGARCYTLEDWSGDLFDKSNPVWQRAGIVKRGSNAVRLTVSNTGSNRAACGRILRQITSIEPAPSNLQFLAVG
jgi:hypothetical protein